MTGIKVGDTGVFIKDYAGDFLVGSKIRISRIQDKGTVSLEYIGGNLGHQLLGWIEINSIPTYISFDTELSTEPEGVWAVIDSDYSKSITTVYATEIEAHRAIATRGYYGEVRFLKYGEKVL